MLNLKWVIWDKKNSEQLNEMILYYNYIYIHIIKLYID